MSNLLIINSSANTGESVSRILIDEAVDQVLKAAPGTKVVRRDLGTDPVPHLTTANLAGVRGVPATRKNMPHAPFPTSWSPNCEPPTRL